MFNFQGTLVPIDVYLPSETSLRIYVEPFATGQEGWIYKIFHFNLIWKIMFVCLCIALISIRRALRAKVLPADWTLFEVEQPSVNIYSLFSLFGASWNFEFGNFLHHRRPKLRTIVICRPTNTTLKLNYRNTLVLPMLYVDAISLYLCILFFLNFFVIFKF